MLLLEVTDEVDRAIGSILDAALRHAGAEALPAYNVLRIALEKAKTKVIDIKSATDQVSEE